MNRVSPGGYGYNARGNGMQKIIDEQRAMGFPALAGTNVTARVPLRDTVLNEVLAATAFAKGGFGPMKAATVKFSEGNRITISLAFDHWMLPKTYQIEGVMAPTVDFAKDPRLLLMLAPSGLLGMVAKVVLGSRDDLRAFLTISGDRVFIDIKALLSRKDTASLVPLLRTIRLKTEAGVLFIEANIQVSETTT